MQRTRRLVVFTILILSLSVEMSAGTSVAKPRALASAPIYAREHSQPAIATHSSVPLRRQASMIRRKSALMPSNAGFLTASQTVLPGSASAFAVGDFNGDSNKDIVAVTYDTTGQPQLAVLLGNGDGTFQAPVTASINFDSSSDVLYAADLNHDSLDDVIVVHGGSSSSMDVFLSAGGGSFNLPTNYPSSFASVRGMTVADINGDGYADVLVADGVGAPDGSSGPEVVTFLNSGSGTFATQTSVVVPGMFPYAVFADVNGDGKLDLVTNTQVFLANAGGYQAGIALPGAPSGAAQDGTIAVSNLTADSLPDIAILNAASQTVSVYLNQGSGNFLQGATYWAGFAPQWLAVSDVNGDHNADLIVGDASSADITVLSGNGDGTFNTVAMGFAAGGFLWPKPLLGDFNGDGKTDVLLLQYEPDYSTGITFLRGFGDGTFLAADNYYAPANTDSQPAYGMGITSADLNGDSVPDFVLGNAAGPSVGVTVFLGNGDGTLKPGVNYGTGGYLEFVASADFNHDGHQDVVASDLSTGDASLFLGNGDGTLQPAQPITVSGGQGEGAGLVVGDFNKDGWPDIAMVAAPSSLYVLLNNKAGGFSAPTTYTLSSTGWQVSTGDLNGDGKLDLVVSMGLNYVAILKGNGDGTFTPMPDVDLGAFYPDTVAIGDLNGDGLSDLAVSVDDTSGSMGIVTLLGNGDGTFQSPVLFPSSTAASAGTESYPGQIRMTDLNRDGRLDLVYTNSGFGTAGVMYGNGDGTFLNPVEFSIGGWPYSVYVTDVNADGSIDAVIGNDDYSGVTTLLNYGGAKVSVASSLNPAKDTDSITFTANISGLRGISRVPSGTVTFKDGTTVLNSVTLSGGTGSLTVSSLTAGTHVISAIYSGDSAFLSGSGSMVETVNQTTGGSYTLAATPTSATIRPGQSATFSITATPLNGFTGSVAFDCGSLPIGLSCQFTPATLSLSGQPATTQLVVTASSTVLSQANTQGSPFGGLPLWASFTGMMFGAVVLESSDEKKRRIALVVLLVVAMLAGTVLLTGCATSTGNSHQPAPVSKTVHVVARSANGQITQGLNLTVKVDR